MEKQNILIGGAWPYANNLLHLGHIAGLISGDILARYYRLKGENVLYVSGTDCHGTPITERAKKEGRTPKEISDYYDNEFRKTFLKMGFSYDLYTKTSTEYHSIEVQKIFKRIYDNGYIYEKVEPQAFCNKCNKFLSDREIRITCNRCGNITKADQCEVCEYIPTVRDLENGLCLECGTNTIQKDNKNLYFALSKFQKILEEHVNKVNNIWRLNAKNETNKYLKEGLLDRAVTRDLDWGIDIPITGYKNKKMYVWIEAVLGYITASKKWCEENNQNFEQYWKNGNNNKIYMVHGKDNINFHSIILNALLKGLEDNYHLVDVIVSTEYLNINDEKISKSKGNGITAIDMVEQYNPDSLRYHIINNGPEKKDTNFSIDNFISTHNNEILNKFGNLVNRTLRFKGLEKIEIAELDEQVSLEIDKIYNVIGKLIEKLEFKEATDSVMQFVEYSNKYYDIRQPWIQKKENIKEFNNTIFTCATIIANLSNLFEPFMPFCCNKIRQYFKIEKPTWDKIELNKEILLNNIEPLFERVDNNK